MNRTVLYGGSQHKQEEPFYLYTVDKDTFRIHARRIDYYTRLGTAYVWRDKSRLRYIYASKLDILSGNTLYSRNGDVSEMSKAILRGFEEREEAAFTKLEKCKRDLARLYQANPYLVNNTDDSFESD